MNFSLFINELHTVYLCRSSDSSYIRAMKQYQKEWSTMVCSLGWDKKVSEYRRMFTLKYVVKKDCMQCIISLFLSVKWGSILIIYMEIRQQICDYSSILFFWNTTLFSTFVTSVWHHYALSHSILTMHHIQRQRK